MSTNIILTDNHLTKALELGRARAMHDLERGDTDPHPLDDNRDDRDVFYIVTGDKAPYTDEGNELVWTLSDNYEKGYYEIWDNEEEDAEDQNAAA